MPVGKALGAFQFRNVIYQPKLADILVSIDGVVTTLKRNAMIPNKSVSIYRFVQLTITVIAIHLELVGFHEGQLSGSHTFSTRCGGH